jgi:hypothetical protein
MVPPEPAETNVVLEGRLSQRWTPEALRLPWLESVMMNVTWSPEAATELGTDCLSRLSWAMGVAVAVALGVAVGVVVTVGLRVKLAVVVGLKVGVKPQPLL